MGNSRAPRDELRYIILCHSVPYDTAAISNNMRNYSPRCQRNTALFLSSTSIPTSLSLPTHLLLLLLPSPLSLLFQEIPLVLCAHAFQPIVSHLLFLLLALESPLLRFLLVALLSQLLLFFLANGTDLAADFGTEMGVLREEVGKAQKVAKNGETGLVG